MSVDEKIAALSQRITKLKDSVETEEATKNAFIMPFIGALGYDVFDPSVVIPEYTADVGVKKGEKVDYAIKRNSEIAILIECKPCKTELMTIHTSQLYRYFSVTSARFAVLTNGIKYWFYSDLDEPNKMDAKPFFEFDMLNFRPAQIEELSKFCNENFDIDTILVTASDLKYRSLIMKEFASELDDPCDELSRMLVGRVYDGKLTANVMSKFGPLVARAIKDTIRELVNQKLSSAIDDTSRTALPISTDATKEQSINSTPQEATVSVEDIVTTDEERDGYNIVRAIVREVISISRIYMRDTKSYCGILIDDNNRKPLCRLHFNRDAKYIGLFDSEKNEERIRINCLEDIFNYSERLKETALRYGD
ncbi:MAG: type I restriction enzyme HsdR N-terminal domain-containing protein [Hyphomicrobiales bacterium]|nr:type I restriction enzyme HsdR N-terminal domain-containing protein [Hyphomicrobiales bacterium]